MVLLLLIYRHYKLKLDVLKTKEQIDHYETIYSSGFYKYLIIEMVICAIHSPPLQLPAFPAQPSARIF